LTSAPPRRRRGTWTPSTNRSAEEDLRRSPAKYESSSDEESAAATTPPREESRRAFDSAPFFPAARRAPSNRRALGPFDAIALAPPISSPIPASSASFPLALSSNIAESSAATPPPPRGGFEPPTRESFAALLTARRTYSVYASPPPAPPPRAPDAFRVRAATDADADASAPRALYVAASAFGSDPDAYSRNPSAPPPPVPSNGRWPGGGSGRWRSGRWVLPATNPSACRPTSDACKSVPPRVFFEPRSSNGGLRASSLRADGNPVPRREHRIGSNPNWLTFTTTSVTVV